MKDPILICAGGFKYGRHSTERIVTLRIPLAATNGALLLPAGTL